MKEDVSLNDNIQINLPKLIESKLLVQANSGGGKSWALRRILEQSHGKVQHIILDSEGEFGTLREEYDYVLAGKGGDTPAEPRSAALLARKLLELNVSAIIDLYELHPQERKRFVRIFLESLINAPKELWHDCIVVIDEAHTYAPEKGQSEAMDAVIGLCALGRKRGFSAILATQRISKLNKDAAAECNNKLIGRASQDIDMKRAADELGFTSREQMLSLRALKPGEFYAFGPAISDDIQKVTVGDVRTTHPKAGSRSLTKVVPPTDGIKKILGKLADLPKEAHEEAHTIAEYKAQVTDLRRKLTIAEQKANAPRGEPTKIQRIEVPTIGKKAIADVLRFETAMRKMLRDFKTHNIAADATANTFEKAIDKLSAEIAKVATNAPAGNIVGSFKPVFQVPKNVYPLAITPSGDLSGPEQRIVNAIAWLESLNITEPEQTAVAFLAGYTYCGGGFNNPRGSLRTKGLVEYRGDRIALSDSGRAVAQVPEMPLTTEELHAKVISVLPGPEQKLLKVLIEVYPQDIGKDELADRSGYAPGSGGFNNPCGRLRTLGLIEYPAPGRVKAKPLLFL
jgi:uncharacterized protein